MQVRFLKNSNLTKLRLVLEINQVCRLNLTKEKKVGQGRTAYYGKKYVCCKKYKVREI